MLDNVIGKMIRVLGQENNKLFLVFFVYVYTDFWAENTEKYVKRIKTSKTERVFPTVGNLNYERNTFTFLYFRTFSVRLNAFLKILSIWVLGLVFY
jgi:hypothetical protein